MSESQFFDLVTRVDAMLSTRDIASVIPELRDLLKNSALNSYFFDNLKDVDWLHPLVDAGFFASPPTVKRDPDRGTLEFPPWPESRYLARVAAQAPEVVLEVALQIPETDNVRVHEDFVDAVLEMPADLAVKLVPKAKRWIELPHQLLLPEKLGALVEHLAKGTQVEAALDLARSLLAVLPDPRAIEKTGDEETYRLPPEPRARFDTWDYKEILEQIVPLLVAAAEEEALTLLCNLLDSALHLSQRDEKYEGPEDLSWIWRPAIEDHEQNHPRGLRDFLVTAVRDAAEQIAKTHPSRVPALVEKLKQRPRLIFQRIALHLLRVCPDRASSLIAQRLTDKTLFDQEGARHEYVLLARDHFTHLSQKDQETILNWIAAGPDIEQFKVWHEQDMGRSPTDEEVQRSSKYWRLERLAPLRDALPPEWKQRYDEWVTEVGEPEHPEFVSYGGSWVGPTSPKSAEDLRSMNVEEIVTFLGTWQPSGDLTSPSSEGLGRELTAMVASVPERFASRAEQFQELDPTYVRALLSGFCDAAKQKRSFSWRPVLELCHWVMEQPREIPGRKRRLDRDPGWIWTRKTIASLLSGGFESQAGPAEIPFELRRSAWNVLKPITDDPNPTPEDEARHGGSNMDPATLSINTTRGEAMHAVVRYALWVRRHLEKEPDGKERISRGFNEMGEVRDVLNAHLDPEEDPSLAIRAVYGQWFPWLVLLDREWAVTNVSKIFPPDESLQDLRDAAWETYIIFCEPYGNVFDVLRDEYSRAVERLDVGDTQRRHLASPEESLAEHLMVLYWRGKLTLDESDGLLMRFYAKASDTLCGHAFSTEGRRFYNTKETILPEVLGRLKALWERRLAAAQADPSPTSHAAELAAFGWWFASAKFDDTWALDQLTQVLNLRPSEIVPRMRGVDHLVAERLARLVENNPRQVVRCLRLMVEGDVEGWRIRSWREHVRTILDTARQNPDMETRQAAVDLVHRLGARGYFEFRDLLQEAPS